MKRDYNNDFLNPLELTEIVLQSAANWTIGHKKMKYKSCSLLQRNIQYRARLKGPPFWQYETRFRKKIPRGSPFSFVSDFCYRMDVENPKGSPFSVSFRHCESFFNFVYQRVPHSIFLMICDRNV